MDTIYNWNIKVVYTKIEKEELFFILHKAYIKSLSIEEDK